MKRLTAGLTQVQLADLVAVSQAHISAIELGDTGPGVHLLHRLATALNCAVEDLMIRSSSE